MNSEEKDNLLDRYITGQPMSADEETQVNKLLDTDADFRAEYWSRQDLFDAGRRERRAAWEARPHMHLPTERKVFPMRWAAAASVVLVLGLGLLWFQQPDRNGPLTGNAPLFNQQDVQIGLAGNDSSAAGTVVWIVTKSPENQYEFSQLDTLRIFATDPGQWRGKTWRLTSLSEVRYQLQVDNKTYLLEQGRTMRLPLEPSN